MIEFTLVCVCVCSRCMISMLCSVCTFFQIYNSIIIYNPRIFVNKDYYTYIYIYILPQSVFTHMDMPVKLQNNTSKNTYCFRKGKPAVSWKGAVVPDPVFR